MDCISMALSQPSNCAHVRVQVKFMGTRENAVDRDFSTIGLEEDEEEALKEGAIISMGTEISSDDMANMISLCDQVISAFEMVPTCPAAVDCNLQSASLATWSGRFKH